MESYKKSRNYKISKRETDLQPTSIGNEIYARKCTIYDDGEERETPDVKKQASSDIVIVRDQMSDDISLQFWSCVSIRLH